MKTKKILLILVALASTICLNAQKTGTFKDIRDGHTYKWVKIGNQIWMAENLNYNTGNSWCYDNRSSNCQQYGRLYDWQTAKGACPSGWHLPSISEFDTLSNNVGGEGSNAFYALKTGGSSGFSALFGGWRYGDGNYYSIGNFGYFWSSSQSLIDPWYMGIGSHAKETILIYDRRKVCGFSVRCLQD